MPSTLASISRCNSGVESFFKFRESLRNSAFLCVSAVKLNLTAEAQRNAEVRREIPKRTVSADYFPAVSSINPVASRTSIFDPNSTGMAHVEASATS